MNERIKKLIEAIGDTQTELAEKLETFQSNISRLISGKLKLSPEIMQKMHKIYNVNLNWLICGTGKMFLTEESNYTTEQGLEQNIFEPQTEYKSDDFRDLYNKESGKVELLKEKLEWYEKHCDCRKEDT